MIPAVDQIDADEQAFLTSLILPVETFKAFLTRKYHLGVGDGVGIDGRITRAITQVPPEPASQGSG